MNRPIQTRTFKSGNSEAVRLPKELGFGPGTPVTIERNGDIVMIRAVLDPAEEKRRLLELIDALKALPRPPQIEVREPIEVPDRPGL